MEFCADRGRIKKVQRIMISVILFQLMMQLDVSLNLYLKAIILSRQDILM